MRYFGSPYSTVEAKLKTARSVLWNSDNNVQPVQLWGTLAMPEMSMSQFSVIAVVKNNISVLFMLRKAVMFDQVNNMAILRHAE